MAQAPGLCRQPEHVYPSGTGISHRGRHNADVGMTYECPNRCDAGCDAGCGAGCGAGCPDDTTAGPRQSVSELGPMTGHG